MHTHKLTHTQVEVEEAAVVTDFSEALVVETSCIESHNSGILCMHICTCVCVCVYMCVDELTCLEMHDSGILCVYVHVCVCMCV